MGQRARSADSPVVVLAATRAGREGGTVREGGRLDGEGEGGEICDDSGGAGVQVEREVTEATGRKIYRKSKTYTHICI